MEGDEAVDFAGAGRRTTYEFIDRTPGRFGYRGLGSDRPELANRNRPPNGGTGRFPRAVHGRGGPRLAQAPVGRRWKSQGPSRPLHHETVAEADRRFRTHPMPVTRRRSPLALRRAQRQVHQLRRRAVVGEAPSGSYRPAHRTVPFRAVQALDRIDRGDRPPDRLREREERGHMLPGAAPASPDRHESPLRATHRLDLKDRPPIEIKSLCNGRCSKPNQFPPLHRL